MKISEPVIALLEKFNISAAELLKIVDFVLDCVDKPTTIYKIESLVKGRANYERN